MRDIVIVVLFMGASVLIIALGIIAVGLFFQKLKGPLDNHRK